MRTFVVMNDPGQSTDDATIGGKAASTVFVRQSYVSAGGETQAAAETSLAVPLGQRLQAASPAALAGAIGYNVYASTATGTEKKQNAAPIAIGTPWVEPATGLSSTGAAVPVANTAGIANPGANGALSLVVGSALAAVDAMNAILHAIGLHATRVELKHYDPLVNPGATSQRSKPNDDSAVI